jgi:N-acetylglucosaminyl-diphospho-decaprenol L-rhamnosyltransferase
VPAPTIDLVIVHRGVPDVVGETVHRFLDQDDVDVRIVVVDNASSEDDREKLAVTLPDHVVLLPQDRNLGFGPAANVGFRWYLERGDTAAGAEWLAVAPHDARPDPDCLRVMLDELDRRPRAGLASADVGDGLTPIVDRYIGAIPVPARVQRGWEPAGYPHGTLMLARRACLEGVGLFDERYFAYCEEADLALRARAAGWQVGVVRGAEVRNPTVGSHVAVVDYLQLRNTLLLVQEHFGLWPVTMRTCMALYHLGVGLCSPRRRGPYWDAPARVAALGDFFVRRFGPPPPAIMRRDLLHQDAVTRKLRV